jgi:hypothetical protein
VLADRAHDPALNGREFDVEEVFGDPNISICAAIATRIGDVGERAASPSA